MIVTLSVFIADDELSAVQHVANGIPVRDFLKARLVADYESVLAKGKRGLETQQLIRDGAIDAVWAREEA
jgi:hypothetical protein